jgi:hypothetical protein
MAPRVSSYLVTSDISLSQLVSLGILPAEEGVDFLGADISDTRHLYIDLEPIRSYTLSGPSYVDLDMPDNTFEEFLDYGPDPTELLWRNRVTLGDHEDETPTSSM